MRWPTRIALVIAVTRTSAMLAPEEGGSQGKAEAADRGWFLTERMKFNLLLLSIPIVAAAMALACYVSDSTRSTEVEKTDIWGDGVLTREDLTELSPEQICVELMYLRVNALRLWLLHKRNLWRFTSSYHCFWYYSLKLPAIACSTAAAVLAAGHNTGHSDLMRVALAVLPMVHGALTSSEAMLRLGTKKDAFSKAASRCDVIVTKLEFFHDFGLISAAGPNYNPCIATYLPVAELMQQGNELLQEGQHFVTDINKELHGLAYIECRESCAELHRGFLWLS
eukprot:TRINITY_DN19346_c0_g1_i1.p1 TRINITY_DN19346_c0_g1~~TRINITY_DN19346_c0_g1_i1.p1  ORF type:complete len:281 (-),score=43.47 TRINITY_DN19346_c0_g1_i1:666-1508(-)